ncbi:MAG: hypothetical protein ACHQAX_07560 [Gammaproteobacteria bacterium]
MGYSLKKIIYHTLKYPLIAWLALKSYPLAKKAAMTPNKVYLDTPYQGQPILLIALYQQGKLRPDIARLLVLAKEMGLYVIGVNNATLTAALHDYFDCYIERVNFGRDFASYKVGFEKVFHLLNNAHCPRLLMLNDSVYYDTSRLKPFLDRLVHPAVEVLGATDNHEITYHFGSFCLSIDGRILRHPLFQRYWAEYKSTDVRLLVIYRGELELSRCLKACVSNPFQFRALYDLGFLERTLSDKANMETFLLLSRRSPHLAPHLLRSRLSASPSITEILAYSKQRGQIHLNAAFLVFAGLPLVKLDGFYRGVFSEEDVNNICNQLPTMEAEELKSLLLRRSYGGDAPFEWKKILFMWGLI